MSSKKQKVASGSDVERSQKACLSVLRAMQRNPDANPFLMPVDWKALKLPTYPKIVKNPMDLGTVEQKLQANRYAAVADFAADVRLIWTNAQAFNLEGSDIYELAASLSDDFESKMAQVPTGPLREGASKGASSGSAESMSADSLAQCKAVVRDLRKHKDAGAFLEPVDWKQLGIMDYPKIIKRPMDLGTIMKRLESGQYSSVQEVVADVDLVWGNAMTYNQDESFIYKMAADLKAYADRKMAPLSALARESSDVPHELTFEMKKQLNENAALLSSKDLYGMVGIVEDTCKRAIDQSSPQEVEIDIDSLDLQTFLKVDKYVQDCIARARRKSKQ